MAIPLQHEPEIEYPDSDGKPMAETPIHLEVMLHGIQALKDHFAEEPDVYVSGNMLLYYEKGNRSASVAPDVFVVRGVPKDEDRDVYLLWREGKAPCFVLEVTSKTTREEDQTSKKSRYARLGGRPRDGSPRSAPEPWPRRWSASDADRKTRDRSLDDDGSPGGWLLARKFCA